MGNTLAEFERDLADNLCYQRGTTAESASAQDVYWTLAATVRDRLAAWVELGSAALARWPPGGCARCGRSSVRR